MNIVFIRIHKDMLKESRSSETESSSSKSIIAELVRQELASHWEEWRFSDSSDAVQEQARFVQRTFRLNAEGGLPGLAAYVTNRGQPDVLWVEGSDYPPALRSIFAVCDASVKVVYSKDWKPHKIEHLQAYDLCLVDEPAQIGRVEQVGGRPAVWDKLVDYAGTHYPLGMPKRFDVCYVASLRARKNHEMLFDALAKIQRPLRCVCVGGDPEGRLRELRELARQLGLDVLFTGALPKEDVNRYVNDSRLGVLCSNLDAAPRVLQEYMAADVPVVVHAGLRAGLRYVGEDAGVVAEDGAMPEAIVDVLDRAADFSPRAHVLTHFSKELVAQKAVRLLDEARYRHAATAAVTGAP